ncbi:hypothetical protein KC19_12G021100 [Ceratodon purpureus]|uniref:Uncharacterized protein n=1 Tax=Ceratodon purpureus TaxID=3225 RepID=A0A8T0G518_CERPU|nr:hypothetical protein KC19_12G021100 [Ceratodon purpureus]
MCSPHETRRSSSWRRRYVRPTPLCTRLEEVATSWEHAIWSSQAVMPIPCQKTGRGRGHVEGHVLQRRGNPTL